MSRVHQNKERNIGAFKFHQNSSLRNERSNWMVVKLVKRVFTSVVYDLLEDKKYEIQSLSSASHCSEGERIFSSKSGRRIMKLLQFHL